MTTVYSEVAARAGWRCEYCRAPEEVFNCPFEVEQIVPRALSGSESAGNLALACRSCNRCKSAATFGIDPVSGEEAPLFHPRIDYWDDHFRANVESGQITGVTPTGRASVAVMRMNGARQVRARLRWIELKLFP